MSEHDAWEIILQRWDGKVIIHKDVPNDELEYGIDEALREARELEQTLGS